MIPPPPDAACDCEDVDDDIIMVPTTDKPTDIADTVEIMLLREDDQSIDNNQIKPVTPTLEKK